MNRGQTWLIALAAAAGVTAWWFWGDPEPAGVAGDVRQAVNDVLNAIVKGHRATSAPYDTTTGVVPGTPEDLAAAAGVDVETYSLARMIASEEGRSSNTIKAAVAWATVNHAAKSGLSVTQLLTRTKEPSHAGLYGTFTLIDQSSQFYGENSKGKPNVADRYASTASDPYDGDVQIAAAVTSGQIGDFTGGADQFDRPDLESNPDNVAAKRTAAGQVLADVPGIDPDVDGIRFWRAA